MSDCRPPLASPSRPATPCRRAPAIPIAMCSGRPTCSRMPRAVPTRRPTRRSPGWPRCTRTWASAAPWWCRPCHGADHAALLDALARSEGRYRGVALLGRMRPQRRYARCTTPACAGPASTSCPIWAARRTRPSSTMGRPDRAAGLAPVPASGRRPAARAAAARALPLPFVIDHMGRVRAADGLDAPAFRALLGRRTCRAPG